QLSDIKKSVQGIVHRYTFDEFVETGRKVSLSDYKKQRTKVLEKVSFCANSADIKEKILIHILAWLKEWNAILSDMTEVDIDEHHHCITQMEILPKTFKAIESNVKRLSVISTSLLEDKKKEEEKKMSRKALWKSWKERVIKRPATVHALTPNQMIGDEFATNTKVSEIQAMLQELIDTTMFNKLENNAINYIASTIENLSKALSSLNNEAKVINLHPEICISEFIKFKTLPTSTLKVLYEFSPKSSMGFSMTDEAASMDNTWMKEFENRMDGAQRKETQGSVLKWDSASSHTAQVEMTPDLIEQQFLLLEKPPKIPSKDTTEDKISLKKGDIYQKGWTDEYQSQKRKITKAPYEFETSRSNLSKQTSKQIISKTKVDYDFDLQSQQKTSQEIQPLSIARRKTSQEIQPLSIAQQKTSQEIQPLSIAQQKTSQEIQPLSIAQQKTSQEIQPLSIAKSNFPSTDTKSQGGKSGTSSKKYKIAYILEKCQVISDHKKKSTTELMAKESKSVMSFQAVPSGSIQPDESSEKVKIEGKEHQISSEITTSKEGKTEEEDTSVFTKKGKSQELVESQSKTSESTTVLGSPEGKSEQANLDEFHNAIMSFLKEKIDNTENPLDKKTVPEEELLLRKAEVEKLGIIKAKIASIRLTPRWKNTWKRALRSRTKKEFHVNLADEKHSEPVIPPSSTQFSSPGPFFIPGQFPTKSIAVIHEEAESQGITLSPEQAQAQGITLTPSQALAQGITLTPSQALAQGITLTPQQALAQGITLTPSQALAQGITLTPSQALAQGITLTPSQALAQGITLTPSQALAQGITLTPQQALAQGITLTPSQALAQGITLTPSQALAQGITLTPSQALAQGITLTPSQALAQGITLTPSQALAQGITLTPSQALAQGITLTPSQALAQGITLTPSQALAQGITLTPSQALAQGITLTPQQALAQGITLTPSQALAQGITLTPSQALAQGITLTPQQALAQGITLTPSQALAQGITLTPQQALAQGITLTPSQALAQGITLTPSQALAQGITLTPQQAQALDITLTPQQAQEQGITLTPQQAQALDITLTPQQAQALDITLSPQQAQALDITLTPQQAQALDITLTPQQAQALDITLTPQQAQEQGITLTPQQAQEQGITLTPQQAQALDITLTPQQAQALDITLTPQQAQALDITLTPQQVQALDITLTPQQAQALDITLTPQQAQEQGITLTPQQAQALDITLTPQQAQAQGITLTPQQAQALDITLSPQQTQALGITLTHEHAQIWGITHTNEQAPAVGITLTPEQKQVLEVPLTFDQAQALETPLTAEQAWKLGVAITPEMAQKVSHTLFLKQGKALGIGPTYEQAQSFGSLTLNQARALRIPKAWLSIITRRHEQSLGAPLTSDNAHVLGSPLTREQVQPSGAPFTPGQAQPMGKPCVLTSVSGTKKLKMMIPPSSFQELKEQRYFVDVKAQRKNLILLNQSTETSGHPSELNTTARNLIIETLHTDTVRLGYLFRKYIAYRLIQRARNNIIKRILAIQNSGRGYETQNLYIMLNRIDGYQKKMMGVWTEKQKSLEQKRNQCLRKMMFLFSQLQDMYQLNLSQPVPLLIDKKQKPTPTKFIQQPFLELLMKEDRKSDIFKKFRQEDQMAAIWNADQSTTSYPIAEKTSLHSLWAQLGGYPPIPMLLQLDVQSSFRKSLASIQSHTKELPK
uniref:Family with sequence similarity 186 member A n=1 Tax=Myotis lucifugus TaxID=59463 RepID=G1PRY0_MYOLU